MDGEVAVNRIQSAPFSCHISNLRIQTIILFSPFPGIQMTNETNSTDTLRIFTNIFLCLG